MSQLFQDVRYALRTLRKSPGFAMVAIATLALGIGANTAIFSVVDAALLKKLPYPDPDGMVMLWERPPKFPRNTVSPATFLDWRNQAKLFTAMAARSSSSFSLSGAGEPEQLSGMRVSAGYFDLFGVKTARGRVFLPAEEQSGERVVVLSHNFWEKHFGADTGVIGRVITLDGEGHTIVGVLETNSGFDQDRTQIFVPLAFRPGQIVRNSHFLNVFARLAPNVTRAQAQSEMDAIAAGIGERSPETSKGWGVTIDPLRERVISSQLRQTVLILLGAVVFVFLIACTNLANVTLARVAHRQREMAIRSALGASRWRVARQFLVESALVSLLGGALGFLAGNWLLDVFTALMPPSTLPGEAQASFDSRVLLYAAGLSALSTLIFGLAPAWQGSKVGLSETLREFAGATLGVRRRWMSKALIVCEVALALTLLIGSGLLLRSMLFLQQAELGFDGTNVLTLHVGLPQGKYPPGPQTTVFYDEALRRMQALPGVEQAALVTDLPVVGWTYGAFFGIEGQPMGRAERPAAHLQVVSPDYFRTLRIPLRIGRAFNDRDQAGAPRVAIINETLARKHFPGVNPLGKYLLDDSDPPARFEIVGVVGNVKVYGLGDKAPEENSELYVPYQQNAMNNSFLAVRCAASPLAHAAAVQAEIHAIDKDLPVTSVRAMERVVGETLADERFNTSLVSLFAVTAGILAAVGIFGVVACSVAEQTAEIGIRLALGAEPRDVLTLFLARGFVPIAIGVGIGLCISFGVTRTMAALLNGISATDTVTFCTAPLALLLVSLLACYLPARRALRVDPLAALRHE